jgi:hypothetical protein
MSGVKALEPVHSYILAIGNNTKQAIRAIVIRYPRVDKYGNTIEGELFFNLDGPREFPPGSTFVFTPDEQLTDVLIRHVLHGETPNLALADVCAARRDALLAGRFDSHRFPKTTVSLDSATLKDGTVIGPDRADLIGRESRKRLVDDSLLKNMLDQTISDAALTAMLDEHVKLWQTDPPIDPRTQLADGVGVYQFQLERFLSKSLRAYGRAQATVGLKEMIDAKAAIPPPHRVKE